MRPPTHSSVISVPIRSPATARAMFPLFFRLKTMIGIFRSRFRSYSTKWTNRRVACNQKVENDTEAEDIGPFVRLAPVLFR